MVEKSIKTSLKLSRNRMVIGVKQERFEILSTEFNGKLWVMLPNLRTFGAQINVHVTCNAF